MDEGLKKLLELKEICTTNIRNINRIMAQCHFDETHLRHIKSNEVSDVQDKFVNTKRATVEARLAKLKESPLFKVNTRKIKASQKQLNVYLDERTVITNWEKAMGLLAISLGYGETEIARILGITAQHMRLNIIPEWKQKHILQILDWFKRCPSCGIYLHDLFEGAIKSTTKGLPPSLADVDVEHLRLNRWQDQIVRLKKENKDLKRQVRELKP